MLSATKSRFTGKTFLQILFFLLLILITAFPQDRIHRGAIPEGLNTETFWEIHKPNAFDLQRLNGRESLPLKSKNSNWQMGLRNQQKEFYEEEGFNANDTRITINKKQLGNGFLLIEEIYLNWNGSAWVNNFKQSYTYDGNNNLAEDLYQTWDGFAWVNGYKYLYIYDGNNDRIEALRQSWIGSAWVNSIKYSYTYDGNTNLTEYLYQY